MLLNPEWLPWLATSVALILCVVQGVLSARRVRALEARLRQRSEDLGRDLHAINSGSMGMGRRLLSCEQQLQTLATSLEELRHNDPSRVSYDEASRLVGLGANVDDLMNSCGISRPEAELVSALHQQRRGGFRAVG